MNVVYDNENFDENNDMINEKLLDEFYDLKISFITNS